MGGDESFGRMLRRYRRARDLTQAALAQQVFCAVETIKKLEQELRRPSRQLAAQLADHFGLVGDERAAFLQSARVERGANRLELVAEPRVLPPTERPPPAAPTGTVTFLFSDIEGSTALWEQHAEAMPAALARHDAILRQEIEGHGGHLFKTVGDAVHAAFANAPEALAAALDVQHALQSECWSPISALRVRMALYTGVVVAQAADYLGQPLNRLARLLAAGHGGQILLSRATMELVSDVLPAEVILRDLGERRLKDLTRPEQIFQVVAPGLPSEFPPLRTLDTRPNNLPAQPNAVIGREREVAAVCDLLRRADVRLVTLTGPGGVGKTRLALQVTSELLDEFNHGVWFVNLAPIVHPGLVIPTISQTLGVKERGSQPLAQSLQAYLHEKQLMLILDNFEQVVEASVQIAELLAAAPKLKVLITSRSVLHLSGEHEVVVPPLALPDRKPGTDLARLAQYEAVRLFIQRAQAVRADFAVTQENAPALAEICHRLDGLPLAIELAAARVKLLPPEMLLARLSSRLALLTTGPRDLAARQQTLRNTIDWSYQLLSEREQILFARLAVFVGGCTLEAAEAVCNLGGEVPLEVVEGIASLLDKSLLRQMENLGGEPRFTMLETIREYALERLVASGEEQAIWRQHADYYLALAEMAEPELRGPQQQAWFERLEADHDNLRLAMQRALDSAELVTAVRFGAAMWRFWLIQGYLTEGRARLAALLALRDAQTGAVPRIAAWAQALLGVSRMANDQSDYAAARAFCEESLAIWRELGDRRGIALALEIMGKIEIDEGEYREPHGYLTQSLSIFRELGDKQGMATSLDHLAWAARTRGENEAARAQAEQSLALFEELGDTHGTATVLEGLGWNAIEQGDDEHALTFFTQSLASFQELGDKQAISGALMGLGDVAWWRGEYERASELYRQGLALRQELGDRRGCAMGFINQAAVVVMQGDYTQAAVLYREGLTLSRSIRYMPGIFSCIIGYAGVAAMQGQPERAAQLSGAADALGQSSGLFIGTLTRTFYERCIAVAPVQIDEAAFDAAWATGRARSLEQAIAYALEESDSCR